MGTEKEKIFVFGASGHAKVVIDVLECQGVFLVAGLFDDDMALAGKEFYGYRVIGGRDKLILSGIKRGIVAIGDNSSRKAVASWLIKNDREFITAIHPSAQISRGVTFGRGSVVMAGAVINADAVIGKNVIVNTLASIDHDCVISDCVHIAPKATLCGSVRVAEGAFIGAGATIVPNTVVEKEAIIGAGAIVLKDVIRKSVVVGNPAKIRN